MLTPEQFAVLAPYLDAGLEADARACLDPIWAVFDHLDPAQLSSSEPALRFDAIRASGPLLPPRPLPAAPPPAPPTVPSGPEDLVWTPLADLAALIAARQLSSAEVVDAYGARAQALEPRLNAFITPNWEAARAAAAQFDAERAGGYAGDPSGNAAAPRLRPRPTPSPGSDSAAGALGGPRPLAGLPLGLKDIFATAGLRTTGGSRLMHDHIPTEDAAAWVRLRAAGAVLAGKLNTHEFAAGATNENPHFGPVRNPWDPRRISGGSSGGSAVATAAALVAAAPGSDTGGSIRIPAALCGIVGIKPTYDRVPRDGVLPLAWSLDHIGPLARTVRDAALLLDVLSQSDDCEPAARSGAAHDLRGWHVGVPRTWLQNGIETAVAAAFEAALRQLRDLGATLVDVEPIGPELLLPINRAIAFPEASAWHAAFLRDRPEAYGANVRPRMEAGRLLFATEYLQAQRLRTLVCRRFAAVWSEVDIVATPTVPMVAPLIGTPGTANPLISLTAPINVLGAPALSVPCGQSPAGLPIGLQLVAPPGADRLVCYAGAVYEAATPWHTRRPAV